MTVYFNEASSPQTPSSPATKTPAETAPSDQHNRVATINMKHRHESEILSQLLVLTKAVAVNATPEEIEQLKELEAQQDLAEKDSIKHHAYNEAKKRKDDILAQARAASA